ncbi:MAG: hypothetical protein U0324_33575 [Polyangiales bacterium]
MRAAPFAFTLAALLRAAVARADDRPADPSNYRAVLATLRPGDTMRLAAGSYGLLNVSGLNGRADAPIVIAGPVSGAPAVFNADRGPCCNTIELRNASYVVLRGLTVDGGGVAGAFGVSAGGGAANLVHHITVEGCTFLHHDASQQTVAISTKTPTWGWVIRGNVIRGAGTGLYLGNSDGSSPFVGGLIEGNLVEDTVGYNMEIKYQRSRPAVAGLPTDPQTTVIRHNVWVKSDRASPDGDRPNVLVGGFPDAGAGSMDRYEVYGNVFLHNPRESLFQASGRVTVHDNLFVDVAGTALLLRNHDLPLRQAFVYHNTFYAVGRGVVFGSAAAQGSAVVGNVIFSPSPVSGPIAVQRDNLTDSVPNAAMHVAAPSITPGMMDFYPRVGRCQGAAVDVSPFAGDRDRDVDFNCAPRGADTFRGAYAGEGSNPGWRVVAAPRPVVCGGTVDGGASDAAVADVSAVDVSAVDAAVADASAMEAGAPDASDADVADDAPVADAPGAPAPAGGCGCATPVRAYGSWAWLVVAASALTRRRRARA